MDVIIEDIKRLFMGLDEDSASNNRVLCLVDSLSREMKKKPDVT